MDVKKKVISIIEKEIGRKIEGDISLNTSLLLKKFSNLKVAVSINTIDENYKDDMDNASSILERMDTLKQLHNAGIYTVLFISPIFPVLTNYKNIIDLTKEYVSEYWFENLNLRGNYKETILSYIKTKHSELLPLYNSIYNDKNNDYWTETGSNIEAYCKSNGIKYENYFYHDELVKNKRKKS